MAVQLRVGRIVLVTIDDKKTVRPAIVTSFVHDDDVSATVFFETPAERAAFFVGRQAPWPTIAEVAHMKRGSHIGGWLVPHGGF